MRALFGKRGRFLTRTRPSWSLEQAKLRGQGVGSNVDLRRNKIQSSVFLILYKHCCYIFGYLLMLCSSYSVTARIGALGWRWSNHNGFLKTKDCQVFCKCTNKIQDSTMQPLKTFKPFERIWPLRKQLSNLWMLLVRLQKNLENLLFSEIVVIRQSSSECPGSTSSTIKSRNGREIAWTNSSVS